MTTAKFSAWRHNAKDSSETGFTMEMSPELLQAFNVLGYQTEPWYRAAPPAVAPPIPEYQLDDALDLMAEIISDATDETTVCCARNPSVPKPGARRQSDARQP